MDVGVSSARALPPSMRGGRDAEADDIEPERRDTAPAASPDWPACEGPAFSRVWLTGIADAALGERLTPAMEESSDE